MTLATGEAGAKLSLTNSDGETIFHRDFDDSETWLDQNLAHAWSETNLTDAEKQGFVNRMGLPSWNDKRDSWDDRGTEAAAFTIQQNVVAKRVPNSRTWRQRMADFEFLTGKASPLHH